MWVRIPHWGLLGKQMRTNLEVVVDLFDDIKDKLLNHPEIEEKSLIRTILIRCESTAVLRLQKEEKEEDFDNS